MLDKIKILCLHTINFYNIKTKQSISESLSGLIEESDTLEILYRCEHLCWNAKMDHLGLVFGHGPFGLSLSFHTKSITMSKSTHFFGQPVYGQLINLLDKAKILQISRNLGGERYVKSFDGFTPDFVTLFLAKIQIADKQ